MLIWLICCLTVKNYLKDIVVSLFDNSVTDAIVFYWQHFIRIMGKKFQPLHI
uniref:Uncharacterized protein n=1 Tax=Arundo donax TaxID=35708 RepID=A0A0A9FLQ6_ARUDO